MTAPHPRRTSHWLVSLGTLTWPLFIAASFLVAIVWLCAFGPGTIADPGFVRRVPNADLRAALGVISRALDPAWLTLGAICVYQATVRAEGLAAARRWCGLVLAASLLIAASSALTALPLGPVFYPRNLGWKIGPVPFALPFLWLIVVIGARETALRVLPRLSHRASAILTGAGCALTSLLLDPVAWKYRAWWLWYPARVEAAPALAPWTNHLTWLLAGTALAFAMRPGRVVPLTGRRPAAPVAAYLAVNLLAALTLVLR